MAISRNRMVIKRVLGTASIRDLKNGEDAKVRELYDLMHENDKNDKIEEETTPRRRRKSADRKPDLKKVAASLEASHAAKEEPAEEASPVGGPKDDDDGELSL
jgi:hypothetical protein